MFDENNLIQICFANLQPLLLDRSPIAKNRPLFYGILENLMYFKSTGNIIVPIPFPQLKSDETNEMCNLFFTSHKEDLTNVDISNISSIQHFLSQIGVDGIRVLLGIRKTAGCMF